MGEVNKEFIVLYHSVQCRPVEKSAEHYKEGMVVHSSVEGGEGWRVTRDGGSPALMVTGMYSITIP